MLTQLKWLILNRIIVFFFKSIQDDSGTHLDPEIYTMIELENLYIKGQPPVKPKSSFFNFLGGRKSRKQRNIKL